jgi:hypothetical protein
MVGFRLKEGNDNTPLNMCMQNVHACTATEIVSFSFFFFFVDINIYSHLKYCTSPSLPMYEVSTG